MSLFANLTRYFRFPRKPDFIVGEPENPYLLRWWIIPRNPIFNIYLHKFLRDDDDRALHDHPWVSLSIVIKGSYIEHLPEGKKRWYNSGSIIFRRAIHRHRIQLLEKWFYGKQSLDLKSYKQPCWTIFITGPRIREWGFWPIGANGLPYFIHWTDFTEPGNKGLNRKAVGDGSVL